MKLRGESIEILWAIKNYMLVVLGFKDQVVLDYCSYNKYCIICLK